MSSTFLVKTLLWQCSVLLEDVDPQFTRWTEEELVGWLNEGRRVLVKYLPTATSRTDAIKLQPGTRQSIELIKAANIRPADGSSQTKDMRGAQLLNIVRNMGAGGNTPGRTISIVDSKLLDRLDPNWHRKNGPYVRNYAYDPLAPNYFYVCPGVAGNVWVEAVIAEMPDDLPYTAGDYAHGSSNTVVVGLDDKYVDDLTNYVCARAHLKDSKYSEGNKAQTFGSLFTGSLNALVTAATGVNPNLDRLPFAGSPVGRGS